MLSAMNKFNAFDDFLELCKAVCERMEREGSWPWADSPNPEDLLDSEDNPKKNYE